MWYVKLKVITLILLTYTNGGILMSKDELIANGYQYITTEKSIDKIEV